LKIYRNLITTHLVTQGKKPSTITGNYHVPRTRQTTGNQRQGRYLLMDNDVRNDKYYSTSEEEDLERFEEPEENPWAWIDEEPEMNND